MSDQADKLRDLIHAAPAGARVAPDYLPLVVVTGGRVGVGATTIAVNTAAALADRHRRVLLVEAADEGASIHEVAGVRSASEYSRGYMREYTREYTPTNPLVGKSEIGNVITAGPAGMSILVPHERARRGTTGCESRRDSPTWQKQLMAELQSWRDQYDVMVIDAGAGLTPLARRLWLRAPLVLLVTTPDDSAVLDAYAAIKSHATGSRDAGCENIRVLVNQAEYDRVAAEAQARLSNCCRRFLRQSVSALPSVPRFDEHDEASVGLSPRVWESPNSRFGHAALWLGRAVDDVLEAKNAFSRGRDCKQTSRRQRATHGSRLAPVA